MTFADELREPYTPDNSSCDRWLNDRIRQCIGAVKAGCLQARERGESHIAGMFSGTDADYGDYGICEGEEAGMFFPVDGGLPFDAWKAGVEREINDLGFSRYTVQLITKPETKYRISWTGRFKKEKTGRTVVGLRIEVWW